MTVVNASSDIRNYQKSTNENNKATKKRFKFLRFLRNMYRNETTRPRRTNQWANAMDRHVVKNKTPIFHIGEYEPNEYSSTNPSHQGKELKIHKKQEKDLTIKRKCLNQIENYCDSTTLHGLKYVGDTSLTLGERAFWLMAFTIAICAAAYYISIIYQKWNSSPVIISFSPFDADLTNIPFPAITICNMNQAKKYEAEKILREGPEIDKKILYGLCNEENNTDPVGTPKEDTRWETLRDFLIRVGSSCENMLRLCKWRNELINCEIAFNNDLTDEGLCCSFNRLPDNKIYRNIKEIGLLNRTYPEKVYDWTPEKGFSENETGDDDYIPRRPLGAGAHLGLTVVLDAQIDDYFCSSTSSIGFKVILSNPMETPKMADFGFLVSPGTETRFAVSPSIREATDSLRYVDIEKRQCFFASERKLRYYRTYTNRNCGQECLSNYTYLKCKCVPYFLPRVSYMKICEDSEDHCVNQAKSTMENASNTVHTCNCLPGCFELIYGKSRSSSRIATNINVVPENITCTKSYYASNMAVMHFFFEYSKYTKLLKREIYDFTDFLANTGGLLGVFLGFSLLSIVEVIYYFSLRLICKTLKFKRKLTRKNTNLQFRH